MRTHRDGRATHKGKRIGTRASGTNPRARGTNPRARAPRPEQTTAQWLDSSARRTAALKRRALARLHVTGCYWCEDCADTAWIETAAGVIACGHLEMTAAEADYIVGGAHE